MTDLSENASRVSKETYYSVKRDLQKGLALQCVDRSTGEGTHRHGASLPCRSVRQNKREREREREKREERERERDLYEKDAPSTVTKLNSQTKLTSRLQQGTSICEGRTEHCN